GAMAERRETWRNALYGKPFRQTFGPHEIGARRQKCGFFVAELFPEGKTTRKFLQNQPVRLRNGLSFRHQRQTETADAVRPTRNRGSRRKGVCRFRTGARQSLGRQKRFGMDWKTLQFIDQANRFVLFYR